LIKAIIFDFGNVICSHNYNLFLNKISNFTDKSNAELENLIFFSSDLQTKYESGLISSEEFFNGIVKLCNLKISLPEFIKAYTEIFTPISSTFELIRKLKPKYKISLLSNTTEWHFEYGIKTIEIFDLFDTITLSFEVKERKPGKKIYFDALNKLDLKPSECIYIDDLIENVNSANEIGIYGIHYISHNNLINSLKKFSIKF
jgi:putative hydrolase of the HAD superfamily